MNRLNEIDGIRGWAALNVLLFHFINEMFSGIFPCLKNPLVSPILDGHLPVLIFFILSGDAISSAYFRQANLTSIDRILIKRYFRLTIPIFMSCVIVYSLMRLGLVYNKEAAVVLHRESWMSGFLNIDATFIRLIRYSFLDVYTNHTSSKSFNPMLWTMSVEMVGSMIVFLICYVWGRLKYAPETMLVLIAFLMAVGSMYALFVVGIYLSYLRTTGVLLKIQNYKRAGKISWLGVVGVFGLNACYLGREQYVTFYMVLAVVFVLSVYVNGAAKRFFSNALSRYLGDISFPLYLTHFSILISMLSWGVVTEADSKHSITAAGIAPWVAGALFLSVFVAHIFRKLEKAILKTIDKSVIKILA